MNYTRVLRLIAKSIREAPGLSKGDVKTKVVYGMSDIQLLSRPRNGRFTPVTVDLDTLPPIQRDMPPQSSSPPLGRSRSTSAISGKRTASSPLQSNPKHPREQANQVQVVTISETQNSTANTSTPKSLQSLSHYQVAKSLNSIIPT